MTLHAVASDQDAADEGVLARIVNIFKKLAERDLRRICFGRVTAYRPKGQENFPSFFLIHRLGIIA